MTIYRRKWGNDRLELRLTWTIIGIYYLRPMTDGGFYVRNHQSMPLPWSRFS